MPKNDRRLHVIVTEEFYHAVKMAAASLNMNMANFIRATLYGAIKKHMPEANNYSLIINNRPSSDNS